jgi:hypothetical protein
VQRVAAAGKHPGWWCGGGVWCVVGLRSVGSVLEEEKIEAAILKRIATGQESLQLCVGEQQQ